MSERPRTLEEGDRRLRELGGMLRQFGRLEIGRLIGTVDATDGRFKAWIDLLERCYFMRAELNAVAGMLVDKGVITKEEWQARLIGEFEWYVEQLSEDWPEVEVAERSITIKDPQAFQRRSRAEGWPP